MKPKRVAPLEGAPRGKPTGLLGDWQKTQGYPVHELPKPNTPEGRDLWYHVDRILKKAGYKRGKKEYGHGSFGSVFPLYDLRGNETGAVVKVTSDVNEVAAAQRIAHHRLDSLVNFPLILASGYSPTLNAGLIIREDIEGTCQESESQKLCNYLNILGERILGYDGAPPEQDSYLVNASAALTPAERSLVADLHHALRKAEEVGIVFYDIRTPNVRIRKLGPPALVITDFGLSSGPRVNIPIVENPLKHNSGRIGARSLGYWAQRKAAAGPGGSSYGRPNPRRGGVELYDPRLEQLRAQKQAIYETTLMRELDRKGPFRNERTGRRADADVPAEVLRSFVARYMFAMGTGVQQRDLRAEPGHQAPTAKAVREAERRYSDPDHLLRNRQDYEETLGLARKSGFYRVTREPTKDGFGFFVWPMPPGQDLPIRTQTEAEAKQVAARLSAEADPRQTGRWWKPPTVEYTAAKLSYWLPPVSALRV